MHEAILHFTFYTLHSSGAYPQPTEETAVLRVMVSGSGAGELVVGDSVVPLLAPPQMRSGAATNTLLLAVGRGARKTLWWERPDGLDVAVGSDDLLIGALPSALRPRGWIAFPHTEATVPCIHDLFARRQTVTLVHGEEFEGLTAEWSSDAQGVAISNRAPVSAEIGGRFPTRETRTIRYTLDHPDRLNEQPVVRAQTLRFCPQLADADEPLADADADEPPEEQPTRASAATMTASAARTRYFFI